MPVRLPTASDLGKTDGFVSGRPIATYDVSAEARGAAALGKGAQDLGNSLIGLGQDQAKKHGELEEALADASYRTDKIKLDEARGDETDPEALASYGDKHQSILDSAAGRITDESKRQLWIAKRSPDIASTQVSANSKAFDLKKDAALAGAFEQLQQLQKTAASAQTDEDRTAAIDAGNKLIGSLNENGYLSDVEAAKRRQGWANGYAVESLQKLPASQRLAALAATPEVANSIKETAQHLGISPHDLATVISYETIGTFNPSIRGGAGNRHIGLIQFGPDEQRTYGASQGQTFPEQMKAVEAYLKDRGVKPGMGLLDLYSTINAGRPGLYNASDAGNGGAPGTVRDKVEQQMGSHKANALALLGGDGKAPAPPIAGSKLAEFLSPDQRRSMESGAVRDIERQQREQDSASRTEVATVNSLLKDDEASIAQTGKPVAELTTDRVAKALGPEAAASFEQGRARAQRFHDETNDFDRLPSDQIVERVKALEPKGGAAGFREDASWHAAAAKRAGEVLKQRETDPAAAVDRLPQVQDAKAGGDQQALIKARMTAQEAIGIPEAKRQPVTRAEAAAIVAPLDNALPGTERAVLKEIIPKLDATYGPHAQRVLEYALEVGKQDNDTSKVAASVFRQLGMGQKPTQTQVQQLGAAQVNSAMGAAAPAPATPAAPSATATPQPVAPPDAAIAGLIQNPSKADQFDALFGKGMAAKILKKHEGMTQKQTEWQPGQPVRMSPQLQANAR